MGFENEVLADRLEFLLLTWASWMRVGGAETAIGYPRKSSGIVEAGISSFDDFAHAADSFAARTVDSIINDLEPFARAAVHTEYLGSKYLHFAEGFDMALELAKAQIRVGADRKGIW